MSLTDREKAIALEAYDKGQVALAQRLAAAAFPAETLKAAWLISECARFDGHNIAWYPDGRRVFKRRGILRNDQQVALEKDEATAITEGVWELFR